MQPISHEDVIPRLAEHLRPIFESSPDGVYIWLDEHHSTCNENMARMLGMTVDEWSGSPGFLQHFVAEDDQQLFSWNYWNRVQPLAFPVTFRFQGIRKDGSRFQAETDMVPLTFGGHTIAYHFVRQIGG